jgi:hypothetical protein
MNGYIHERDQTYALLRNDDRREFYCSKRSEPSAVAFNRVFWKELFDLLLIP